MSSPKTLLVAVNAKYVHTNIAVRYISRYCKARGMECDFSEFTINEPKNNVLAKLYQADCDAYGFSCYIWNIGYIIELCKSLKKLRPNRKIFLGGPEVSFDGEELLNNFHFIDYVICGEGETAVLKLISAFPDKRQIIYGKKLENMDELPFPYTDDDLKRVADGEKLVYYETSRGCPFSCSYCLSSVDAGVRFLPVERVKAEIEKLVKNKVQTIKFVDRTFNADKKRTKEIWEHCLSLEGETNFHFEIGADLLTDELVDMLKAEGGRKFQLEVGVQTTNKRTISEISRTMNLEVLKKNILRLRKETEAKLHLDLIAGLPFEDLCSFKKSFNDVYAMRPHVLQLGFLKLLKGSPLRGNSQRYGMTFSDSAPYEVFSTRWMSYDDIIKLKGVEDVLERFYNSERFCETLEKAMESFDSPFEFYERLASYWDKKGLVGQGVKRISLYSHLHEFLSKELEEEAVRDIMIVMKKDFSRWHSNGIGTPKWYKEY